MCYVVKPEYIAERLKDNAYSKARKVTSKWVPVAELPEQYCGNITSDLTYSRSKRLFSFDKKDHEKYLDSITKEADADLVGIHEVMPSALMLYRLLCLFQCTVHSEGPEGYKLVWQVALKHQESGEVIVFREWKGGLSLGHRFPFGAKPSKAFMSDLTALLNLLASDQCPHPYDGTVAGSVA
jgi:hypothetical protein